MKRGLFLLPLLLTSSLALAGDPTIDPGIPGGRESNASPTGLVANLYQFAIMIGGLLAFAAIVYGAVRYTIAAGNSGNQSEGKEWIRQAILGLILLLGAYLILNTINPRLLTLELPSLETLTVVPRSNCPIACSPGQFCVVNGSGNYSCTANAPPTGGGTCAPATSASASPTTLQNSCFDGRAEEASRIANAESGGNPFSISGTDVCQDGNPFSVGLFQINLTVHRMGGLNCPSAFTCGGSSCGSNLRRVSTNPSRYNCSVTNQNLYQQCVAAGTSAQNNIEAACRVYNEGGGWRAWSTAPQCGLASRYYSKPIAYNTSLQSYE